MTKSSEQRAETLNRKSALEADVVAHLEGDVVGDSELHDHKKKDSRSSSQVRTPTKKPSFERSPSAMAGHSPSVRREILGKWSKTGPVSDLETKTNPTTKGSQKVAAYPSPLERQRSAQVLSKKRPSMKGGEEGIIERFRTSSRSRAVTLLSTLLDFFTSNEEVSSLMFLFLCCRLCLKRREKY